MPFDIVEIQNISGSQYIQLPENFRINDDKVYLRKIGGTLYIIPFHTPWQNMFQSLDQFTPDFMDERFRHGSDAR